MLPAALLLAAVVAPAPIKIGVETHFSDINTDEQIQKSKVKKPPFQDSF